MFRLSDPIAALEPCYDVVVVGSGYGAAVAAARLSCLGASGAGRSASVCVLERGRELQPGDYPDTALGAAREIQLDGWRGRMGRRSGLFDFRINRDVSVLVGCGLGGTSLINAGVVIRPHDRLFQDPAWPAAIRDGWGTGGPGDLSRGFDKAEAALAPEVYPRPPMPSVAPPGEPELRWPELKKMTALGLSRESGVSPAVQRARIAVAFHTRLRDNGVQEHQCVLCGDCVTGCNYGAKKTLITNYLPEARNHGAEIYCGVDVRWIERVDDGWLVFYRLLDAGRERFAPPPAFVRARTLILGAGTLGSTEILLRSRARGLPISDQLGTRFTGNGDVVAFGYNTHHPVNGFGRGPRTPARDGPSGPTITGLLDERIGRVKAPEGDGEPDLLIQEGAIPGALTSLARLAFPILLLLAGRGLDRNDRSFLRHWGRTLISVVRGVYHGAFRNTLTYLAMSHEQESGDLLLIDDRVRVIWPKAGQQPVFKRVHQRLQRAVWRMGGFHLVNPLWSRMFGRRLMTVHPLGGCPMGETAETGVVNDRGQVFVGAEGDGPDPDASTVYESLYVCDGSVVPTTLGANPLLTITALAERTCDLIEEERGEGAPADGQAGGAGDAPARPRPAASPRPGLVFSERLHGEYHSLDPDAGSTTLTLFATVVSGDVESMLRDPPGHAGLTGTVRAPALSHRPLTIRDGRFQLFDVDPNRVEMRRMRYRMTLHSVEGDTFTFIGAKYIHDQPFKSDLWSDLTRLHFLVFGQRNGREVVLGHGEARMRPRDAVRAFATARIVNVPGRFARWRHLFRLGQFYLTTVFKQFGWPFGPVDAINPHAPRRRERLLEFEDPELQDRERRDDREKYPVVTGDQATILLTRFKGGEKGPVMLAPGFGTSTLAFTLPTIRTNITEYLANAGYDVWLLDWRASERTASSRTQFTVDDVARYDYPAAIRYILRTIREESDGKGPTDVQLLVHCVASVAAMMSILGDHLPSGVRSVICSQFFTHVDHPWPNQLKAHLRTARLMHALGFWPMLNPDITTESPFSHWIIDRLLHLYPTEERCRNPVCRRNLFLYGEVYRHDQLNAATHDAVYDMFDRANLTTFLQLTRMIRHRRAVAANRRGPDYLDPDNGKRVTMPVTLLQGARNGLFLPSGAIKALAWLRANADGRPGRDREQSFRTLLIPEYGHMDVFIGKDASRDVFPLIQEELVRQNDL